MISFHGFLGIYSGNHGKQIGNVAVFPEVLVGVLMGLAAVDRYSGFLILVVWREILFFGGCFACFGVFGRLSLGFGLISIGFSFFGILPLESISYLIY